MSREQIVLTQEERNIQLDFAQRVRQSYHDRLGRQPMGCVVTFGCQQNVADGQKLMGMLADCGFTLMLDALSGNLSTDFNTTVSGDDRYISGDGSCIIDVDAMSGHVRIMKNS